MKRFLSFLGAAAGLLLVACPTWAQVYAPPGPRGSTCEPPLTLPPGYGMPGYTMPGTTPSTPSTGARPSDQVGQGNFPQGTPGAGFGGESAVGAGAAQSEAGGQPSGSYSPAMFGDLIGVTGQRVLFLPKGVTPPPGTVSVNNRAALIAPGPTRSAFKITENESPRPEDRVYLTYNYYNNVDRTFTGPGVPQSDLHREMFGLERTFLDGNASIGLRVPFLELTGGQGIDQQELDDISVIFKYAFAYNRQNGDVLSGGMVLTFPTGESIPIVGESSINSTIFSPFIGYIYHFTDDFFVQGFSSVAVPTDARDVTLLFNSVAFGYHAYRATDSGDSLRQIVPTVELHLNNPLNHRGLDTAPIGYADELDVTTGVHVMLNRAEFGLAVCVPVTGPKPMDFEIAASFNYHF
jgi:hypothetical protein